MDDERLEQGAASYIEDSTTVNTNYFFLIYKAFPDRQAEGEINRSIIIRQDETYNL